MCGQVTIRRSQTQIENYAWIGMKYFNGNCFCIFDQYNKGASVKCNFHVEGIPIQASINDEMHLLISIDEREDEFGIAHAQTIFSNYLKSAPVEIEGYRDIVELARKCLVMRLEGEDFDGM